MSKMDCVCGHVIRDQTDDLPYKAWILVDEDTQRPIALLATAIVGLLEARRQGPDAERDYLIRFHVTYGNDEEEGAARWVDRYTDRSDLVPVLYEVIFAFWKRYDRKIYECEHCGRIYLPDPTRRNHYLPYLPEEGQRGVLASWYHHPPQITDFPLNLPDSPFTHRDNSQS